MKILEIKAILMLTLNLLPEMIKMGMNHVLEMIIMRVFGSIQPSALLRDEENIFLLRKERDVSEKGNSIYNYSLYHSIKFKYMSFYFFFFIVYMIIDFLYLSFHFILFFYYRSNGL